MFESSLTILFSGHSWECLLYSYTSLLCPGGYTKNQGQSSSAIFRAGSGVANPRAAISEVERARINQVQMLVGYFNVLKLSKFQESS